MQLCRIMPFTLLREIEVNLDFKKSESLFNMTKSFSFVAIELTNLLSYNFPQKNIASICFICSSGLILSFLSKFEKFK